MKGGKGKSKEDGETETREAEIEPGVLLTTSAYVTETNQKESYSIPM